MTVNVLELREISKSFPGVQALSNVSLIVRPGTVHAICGENGAGKSTLIKIATGAQSADSGVIQICGDRIDHASRRTVQNLGVRAIFQERQIARNMNDYIKKSGSSFCLEICLSSHGIMVGRVKLFHDQTCNPNRNCSTPPQPNYTKLHQTM